MKSDPNIGFIYLFIYGFTVPLSGLGDFFQFFYFYTVARTSWTGDQPVARPLLTQEDTNTE
jgi:hypothetical protein